MASSHLSREGEARDADEEAEYACGEREPELVAARLGEGVVEAGQHRLQQRELRVQPQRVQHEEEQHRPAERVEDPSINDDIDETFPYTSFWTVFYFYFYALMKIDQKY